MLHVFEIIINWTAVIYSTNSFMDLAEWCHGRVLTMSCDILKNTLMAPLQDVYGRKITRQFLASLY